MKTMDLRISVPFRVQGVRKGGRVARETVCRTEVNAKIPIVDAADVPLAVRCTDLVSQVVPSRDYFAYQGAIYCEMRDATERNGLLHLSRAIGQLVDGARYVGGMANPFANTGPFQVDWADFEASKWVEDTGFRSIASDDHERVLANATRLASEFLITSDCRVLRRSVGPHVVVGEKGFEITADDFDRRPSNVFQSFGLGQLEQARAWHAVGMSDHPADLLGEVEIFDASCLPDGNALAVARAICSVHAAHWTVLAAKRWGDEATWCEFAAKGRGDGAVLAADAVAGAAGRLRGLDGDEFLKDLERNRWPQGARHPGPEDIVEAVEGMRSFYEGPGGDVDVERSRALPRPCREAFVRSTYRSLDRWDLFVRDTLPDPEPPPDIALPEGPRP